ncbi:sigma-54-dependent transcriptional regulator [Insolitispirillum peregrinum]|uniref:Two-component system, repressor protein LuxO n=1 Tax=Insolitispirillum peregrinum TaxID=80876 RepID=A0A1N7LUC6_9PROT|nr:sigma-54 dependent transcriptional regulator [Insolitispirillum peregrinum]SIS77436.1 two-component system, repressor protein LuxO [Insolitispirillum peregrinum]
MTTARVLIVEDDPIQAERYAMDLDGFDLRVASAGAEALSVVASFLPDLVVLDVRLPDMNGLDVLRRLRADGIPSSVIIVTSHGSVNMAVEAMQAGANDFLVKPFTAERLLVTVRNILENQRLSRQVQQLTQELGVTTGAVGFFGFTGGSPIMRGVYRTIEAAAPSKATVFITGESGTGKELCAEAIHRASPRAKGPFVAVNCAAIPQDLMESELFGHVKGAFTGATGTRDGAASRAHGGTLFLDEICEMDINLQSKLLRFLQTGTVQKVGGDGPEKVDIRVVCATNRDPLVEVEEGRFREDLYYRLHVIPIQLPPLRERPGDALEIARTLLGRMVKEEEKSFSHFAKDAEVVISAYPWPGNVRQLENCLRNAVVLHDGDELTLAMLPPPLNTFSPKAGAMLAGGVPVAAPATDGGRGIVSDDTTIRPLWQVEKETIERAISLCSGNIPKAAALLEISPSTIYRKKVSWENAEAV